ncbi:MAG TPA: hypothetical protein V6D20_08800 [Candidatus Obscuribacterales bacterium]
MGEAGLNQRLHHQQAIARCLDQGMGDDGGAFDFAVAQAIVEALGAGVLLEDDQADLG